MFYNWRVRLLISVSFVALSMLFVATLFAQQPMAENVTIPNENASVTIPIGRDSYKIVVREDGVYALTYEALQAAGMAVDFVDPSTFEMMHNGESLAYQFIGDDDNVFEAGEEVRFFGWAFDGSSRDQFYVDANYYWLWANGTPARVTSRPSSPTGVPIDRWRSTIVFEQDNHFNVTRSNDWDDYEFEAEAWFIARIASNPAGVNYGLGSWGTPNLDKDITPEMGQPFREYTFEIPDPVTEGTAAQLTTEVFSLCEPSQIETHTFGTSLNGVEHIEQWDGRFGRTFLQTIPAGTLLDGDNILRYDALTPPEHIKNASLCGTQVFGSDLFLPNRSILAYERALTAVDDQLLFTYSSSGTYDFMVSGFAVGDANSAVVWDVTDRAQPTAITLSDEHITDDGGTFTWTIGGENLVNSRYLATAAVKTPDSLTQYVAPNLTMRRVHWIGISHADFMEQAERLAAYRGGMPTPVMLSDGTVVSVTAEVPRNTIVVDVADVINQYGYGYNVPQAIQAYYKDAYYNWGRRSLRYGVLFGDATINPRQLDCVEQCDYWGEWDSSFETFVVTDLQFTDRFLGLIPTDHTYADLDDDNYDSWWYEPYAPEIAIGRFAVNTLEEAKNMVDKVILYEYNQQIDADYMNNLLFIADNADGGGDFCQATRDITDWDKAIYDSWYPNDLVGTVDRDYVDEFRTFAEGTGASGGDPYCMDNYMEGGVSEHVAKFEVRDDVLAEINSTGAAIVNYRGHGNRFSLSGIINANRDVDYTVIPATELDRDGSLFTNDDRPMVWLSADSLDGDFAFPTARESALSERLMRLEGAGTAGHWSSTGFGFDREHTALHQGFYEALYTLDEYESHRGQYTIGDAITYSKWRYLDNNLGNVAEIWAFTYQGDPGMTMPHTSYGYSTQDYLEGEYWDSYYYYNNITSPMSATTSQTTTTSAKTTLPVVMATVLFVVSIATVAYQRNQNQEVPD